MTQGNLSYLNGTFAGCHWSIVWHCTRIWGGLDRRPRETPTSWSGRREHCSRTQTLCIQKIFPCLLSPQPVKLLDCPDDYLPIVMNGWVAVWPSLCFRPEWGDKISFLETISRIKCNMVHHIKSEEWKTIWRQKPNCIWKCTTWVPNHDPLWIRC